MKYLCAFSQLYYRLAQRGLEIAEEVGNQYLKKVAYANIVEALATTRGALKLAERVGDACMVTLLRWLLGDIMLWIEKEAAQHLSLIPHSESSTVQEARQKSVENP